MRKYTLASSDARSAVDLRNYRNIIESAIHEIMSQAIVTVEQDCYYVSPTPSKGDAIRIGRLICKSGLSSHCIQIPKLFSSIEIKEETHDRKEHKHPGRHH